MSQPPFLRDLTALAEQVTIVDDYTYRVRGETVSVAYQHSYTKWHQPLSHFGQNGGDETQVRANLRQQVAQALYGTFYCAGTTEPGDPAPSPLPAMPSAAERERTTQLLSAVNATQNGFDPHWTVYSIDAYGNAFVTKNGELRQLVANQWEFASPADTSLKVGAVVRLTVTKEDTTAQPVFYHVRGAALVPQQPEFVRVYFHTTFEGALQLVREVTTAFNRYRLPFLFKCLNHPDLYSRTDSAVLYVSKFDFHFAYTLLLPVLARLMPHLRPEVPLFTQLLRPGVSFSEDPGDGQSFGMSRCDLVAEALISAHHKQVAPLAEIKRTFGKRGIGLDRLHLNPNSHFPYSLPVPAREHSVANH